MRRYSVIVFILLTFLLIAYINIQDIESLLIKKFIHQTNLKIENEIELKRTSTLGLAIATAQDQRLIDFIHFKNQSLTLKPLSFLLRKYTNFKNIHFKLLDKRGFTIYATRLLLETEQCKKIDKFKYDYKTDIIVDNYGLQFAAFVPLIWHKEKVGYLEVLSQFNSIVKDLQNFDVDAIVILEKKIGARAKTLSLAIEGYKITNKNPNKELIKILSHYSITRLLQSPKPKILANKIFFQYAIKDLEGKIYGWIIYAKDRNLIYAHYISQSIILRVVFLTILVAIILILAMYFFERVRIKEQQHQLQYLYNILDNLEEIVIMNDGKRMKYANKAFFRFFEEFKSIEDFLSKHHCICDFFVSQKGFITSNINDQSWTKYVYEHKNENIYAKIAYKGKEKIFQVKANKISENEYVVIFIDATQEYQKEQKLRTMAVIDPLTKVYNRYYFEEFANEKIDGAVLTGNALLFAMIDIDHFKSINDTYGHIAGDEVLKEIASMIRKKFRQTDPVFRVGGEEFLIILETSSVNKIIQLLEELRKSISSMRFDSITRSITISIGVAKYKAGDSVQTLYERADKALYEAKKAGRNRLVFEGENNG